MQNLFIESDGGRKAAGYIGNARDCAVRAMAIAMKLDYKVCYKEIADANKLFGYEKSARNGIMKNVFEYVLNKHGYTWHKAPILAGRKARAADLPKGRLIARQSKHFVAVIDGVVYDTFNSTDKMIYGYWSK